MKLGWYSLAIEWIDFMTSQSSKNELDRNYISIKFSFKGIKSELNLQELQESAAEMKVFN